MIFLGTVSAHCVLHIHMPLLCVLCVFMFSSYFPVVNVHVCTLGRPQLCDCMIVFSGCVCLFVQYVCVLAVKHFNGVKSDVCFVYSGMDGCLFELEPG